MVSDPVKAPGLLLMLLEARAPWEYAASITASPLLARAPAGDGHPVIVFPGLATADFSTAPMRRFLRDRGYTPYAWGQGLNRGPRAGVLEQCRRLVHEVSQRHGRKVSLVGWSLGGLYAREMAKELPEAARCVVTLATPFAGHPRATNAWRLYEWVSGQPSQDSKLTKRIRRAPSCPTTSIYSRSDGIVAWQCSVNEPAPHTENIEVHASHVGMGVNPLALYALADRLAQDPQAWQRFHRPDNPSFVKRWFYGPSAAGSPTGAA
jgi:pimeloyl-ACP methyl ester carboxylesterase